MHHLECPCTVWSVHTLLGVSMHCLDCPCTAWIVHAPLGVSLHRLECPCTACSVGAPLGGSTHRLECPCTDWNVHAPLGVSRHCLECLCTARSLGLRSSSTFYEARFFLIDRICVGNFISTCIGPTGFCSRTNDVLRVSHNVSLIQDSRGW